MSALPSIGLVVSTYNQPEYLRRVLRAVARQTDPPDELFVADDGSREETRRAFQEATLGAAFPCQHVWHRSETFRKSRVLNMAIARATCEWVVFLDGDTVPHPRFLEDHRRLARPGLFLQGHRALLGEEGSKAFGLGAFGSDRARAVWRGQLSGWQNAFRWPVPWLRFRADLRGVRGCNLGIWRADLERVNGFNEAFEGWGREDSEMVVRLMNSGLRRLDVRGRAACCHLWHPVVSRERLPANDALLEDAINTKSRRCGQGLDQH